MQIIDIGANGSGVAREGGQVCFVPFSIDGEVVEASIIKQEKRFCLARVDKVLKPSSCRVPAVCPYFEKCGGCQLQHMNYDKQLCYKTNFIKTEFERAFGCEIDVEKCISSKNQLKYRNKINFNIKNNKLCFLDENNNPIQINFCPLFCSEINEKIIGVFNDYFSCTKHTFSALHIRKIAEKYQFTLISTSFELKNSTFLINSLKNLNIEFSLFVSINCDVRSSNITEQIECKYGEPTIEYVVCGVVCQISPASFLQVNECVQNMIYADIAKFISGGKNVINAYGGTGMLAAMLEKHAQKVFSVEINRSAARDCEKLFEKNQIANAISICGDCKNEIPKILNKNHIDCMVVDPPRAGVAASILDVIKKTDIPEILYLSCNPQTLLRDLKILKEQYFIDFVQPYDMFPQTYHIETLVKLSRK